MIEIRHGSIRHKMFLALQRNWLTSLGLINKTGCTCPPTVISQLRAIGIKVAMKTVKINGKERNLYKIIP
jgi:hypothetical protein